MNEKSTGLPPGWTRKGITSKSCVLTKPLEDFKHAEIRYEPDLQWGHDYALYVVDCDGPKSDQRKGIFNDLNKAIQAGDEL